MPTIKIVRTNEFINRFRNIRILVDGIKIGSIGNGEIKDFEIAPGWHTIIAKIDWCGSQELSFECSENESKTFALGSFRNIDKFRSLRYYLFLNWNNYLTLTMKN